MKTLLIFTIFSILSNMGYSQDAFDKCRINRSLKVYCKSKHEKSKDIISKVKFDWDSLKNSEQNFKLLYAQEYNNNLSILSEEKIKSIDSLILINEYIQKLNCIIKEYGSLKELHKKFNKKYCVNPAAMELLLNRLEQRKMAIEKGIYDVHEAKIKRQREAFANDIDSVSNSNNAIVTELNNLSSKKRLDVKSGGTAEITFTSTFEDSTITYMLTVGLAEGVFGLSEYYDEDIFAFLAGVFGSIKSRHLDDILICSAIGMADSTPFKLGSIYPSGGRKNWGDISRIPITIYNCSNEENPINTSLSITEKTTTLSNLTLAFLRSYCAYQVLKELQSTSEKIILPDHVLVYDYEGCPGKSGDGYRKVGFMVVVKHELLIQLDSEFSKEVTSGKPINWEERYHNENGQMTKQKWK